MSLRKEISGNKSIIQMIEPFSVYFQNSHLQLCLHANLESQANPTQFSQSTQELLNPKTTLDRSCPSLKVPHQVSLTKLGKKKKKNNKLNSVSFPSKSSKTSECPLKYSIETLAYSGNQSHLYITEFCKRQGSTLRQKTVRLTGNHSCS